MKIRKNNLLISLITAGLLLTSASHAAIISVSGPASNKGTLAAIIVAPALVTNAAATNLGQEGFNEKQSVTLGPAITTDQGVIAAGTVVDSHMIFLNIPTGTTITSHYDVEWTFSGTILGVMSDGPGALEAASTGQLGAVGSTYATYAARGLEANIVANTNDGYVIAGNKLTVDMLVTQPGDWIRVVTKVPDSGSTAALIGLALLSLAALRRKLK